MTRDPWRYRCPNGHVDVKKRTQRSPEMIMRGGRPAGSPFYCRTCQKYGRDPHHDCVIDLKTGEQVKA